LLMLWNTSAGCWGYPFYGNMFILAVSRGIVPISFFSRAQNMYFLHPEWADDNQALLQLGDGVAFGMPLNLLGHLGLPSHLLVKPSTKATALGILPHDCYMCRRQWRVPRGSVTRPWSRPNGPTVAAASRCRRGTETDEPPRHHGTSRRELEL